MNLLISNSDNRPIYQQIQTQIKNQILSGVLPSGFALPSIRALTKDLRISSITTKRAYEELEREGFIETTPGKGSFVSAKNTEFVREEYLRIIESHLAKSVEIAKTAAISFQELDHMLRLLYDE